MPPQALRGVDAATGNPRRDAASTQGATQVERVIRLVRMELGRAFAGTARFSSWPNNGWDGVNEWEQLGCIMGVGGREPHGQWDPIPIHHEVVLGAGLAAVDRARPSLRAPLFARTLSESTLARDQSMAASSPN